MPFQDTPSTSSEFSHPDVAIGPGPWVKPEKHGQVLDQDLTNLDFLFHVLDVGRKFSLFVLVVIYRY